MTQQIKTMLNTFFPDDTPVSRLRIKGLPRRPQTDEEIIDSAIAEEYIVKCGEIELSKEFLYRITDKGRILRDS